MAPSPFFCAPSENRRDPNQRLAEPRRGYKGMVCSPLAKFSWDFGNRPGSEPRKEILLEHPLHFDPVVLGPGGLLLRKPFERDRLKGICSRTETHAFLDLAQLTRIDAIAQMAACRIRRYARFLQTYIRVRPQGE